MSKEIDEKENKLMLEKLQDLGLNEKESRVYLALLPRRDVGTSKLMQATGLHGQFVYLALDKLEKLGLAKHVVQNGRKKFSANTPQRLLALVEEKKLTAQSIARELQSRFSGERENDFEVFQGESAFVGHEIAMLERSPEGSRIDVISGLEGKYFTALGTDAEEYERIRVERRIGIRYIGIESGTTIFQQMEKDRPYWTYRTFPGLSTGQVDMGIWPDSIVLNIFGDPIFCLALRGKEVVEGYRGLFEALWNVSKK